MVDKIRVAVVDNHPLFRDGIACILKSTPNFELVAQGESLEDAVAINADKRPDVLLLDIAIRGNGIEALKQLTHQKSCTRVIVMSASGRQDYLVGALKAGARGYFLKSEGGQELIRAIEAICKGESYVTPSLAARMFEHMNQKKTAQEKSPELTSLTRREMEILCCVELGLTNKEIAIKLSISEKTVKHYMTNIMNKLQVSNRVQAALIAQKAHPRESDRDDEVRAIG